MDLLLILLLDATAFLVFALTGDHVEHPGTGLKITFFTGAFLLRTFLVFLPTFCNTLDFWVFIVSFGLAFLSLLIFFPFERVVFSFAFNGDDSEFLNVRRLSKNKIVFNYNEIC